MKSDENPSAEEVVRELRKLAVPKAKEGMARFGIDVVRALGVSIPNLRRVARGVGLNHGLALKLWKTGIHEARILASMIDDPMLVTERQMESWVKDFNSWDLCDQCCSNLFDKTSYAHRKAMEWSERDEEFVKRAGFAMMAALAVHDKEAGDKKFTRFYPAIKKGAEDERNYVKKAVNWALRQIGKRDVKLNRSAIELAEEIRGSGSRAARWIASDALRELRSETVRRRLET